MLRKAYVVAVFLCGSLLVPGQAAAWGLEWLDHLTGPGPFVGFKIDARAICWMAGDRDPGTTNPVVWAPAEGAAVQGGWEPGCLRDGRRRAAENGRLVDVDELRAYVSVEAAWLSSSKNEMFPTLRFDPRTEVDLFAFRPAVMFRAFRWVDAGVAIGLNRFSGPALLEEGFTWVSVQPRAVFTPFANSRSRVARAMEFRTDVVFIPENVRDEFIERVRRDLQEQPRSFEGGEIRLMVGVEIDLFRLF
jgi:hypothetical protein